jgi:hypothetical protein
MAKAKSVPASETPELLGEPLTEAEAVALFGENEPKLGKSQWIALEKRVIARVKAELADRVGDRVEGGI